MSDKIYLRPMTVEDTDLIVSWRNNPRVRNNFIYQETFTREIHLNWIKNHVETGDVVQFIICETGTDRPVGSVYFRDISQVHHKAEYGIFIGEDDAIGKGYGSEACKKACIYGFQELKLHKILLRVYAENQPAIASYEKTGFIREGYLRDEVYTQGAFHDIILMGLFADRLQ
ncbi:MAG: UDP-4-amino-4,6-dideoxy-N-acetyl-beta-L-altrosamine N-acetyltransferase [Lachnospiraceae bacterium]|nr:UDP-4-amino-4,6-dideoxy-N-acetyl-beta-L-altrosamine N-acetyltransferase [Lachnospiraceae bacterium]